MAAFVVGCGISRTHQGEASRAYQAQTDQNLIVRKEGFTLLRCGREKWPRPTHVCPCPRDISQSVSHSVGRLVSAGQAVGSHEDVATGNSLSGASRFPVRERHQLDLRESGKNGSHPQTTQFSHSHSLSLSRPLYTGPGSWLFSRAQAAQVGLTESLVGGAIASL